MPALRPLIFVGSRFNMLEFAVTAHKLGHEILGILDHQYYMNTDSIDGIPVIGDERWLLDSNNQQAQTWLKTCDFFVATVSTGEQLNKNIESNREMLRYQRINLLDQANANVASLIDPDSQLFKNLNNIYSRIKLGKGIFVAHSADVTVYTVNIGDYAIIQPQVFIGHHVCIGRNVNIAPMSKIFSCNIGNNSTIGMYSYTKCCALSRKDYYNIGSWSTVWSQGCIDRDVPDNSILTNQGRVLKKYREIPDQ